MNRDVASQGQSESSGCHQSCDEERGRHFVEAVRQLDERLSRVSGERVQVLQVDCRGCLKRLLNDGEELLQVRRLANGVVQLVRLDEWHSTRRYLDLA